MKKLLQILIILAWMPLVVWAAAPWKVHNPEGTLKMALYAKAADSVTVRINYGRQDLAWSTTMIIGSWEYKTETQNYYLVVPPYMKQRITVWRKDDPGQRLELQIPSLEPKRLIEFNISEETVNGARGEGKGKWSLSTLPPGATYQVDGLPISGQTPVGEQEYNVQTYKVLLTKPRFKPTEVLIDVQKDATVAKTIQLEPNWGDYEFTINTDATLEINGKSFSMTPQVPLKFVGESEGLDARRQNYRASAPGFGTVEDFVEVQAGEQRKVELKLPFKYGNVQFSSIPDNCRVVVNGQLWGTTPFTREQVPAGTYLTQFERDGFEIRQATLNVDRYQQEVKMNLALTSGNLHVDVVPGSQVTLDGKLMSKGLVDFRNLEITSHTLLVQHPDYEDWTGAVSIYEENQYYPVTQVPKPAILSVEGNLAGAEVSLDGVVLGSSPIISMSVPAYRNGVNLRVVKTGYTVLDTNIVLAPNSQSRVEFELEDIEERNIREASYARYEQSAPLELGIRRGAGGVWQLGIWDGNFVWSRGLSWMNHYTTMSEVDIGIDTTGGRVDAVDLRMNLLEKRYGFQLKTPMSLFVARASASAMLAPTLHYDVDENTVPNLSWKLKDDDNYNIYMNRGVAIDLFALQVMAGINIHPAFGNIYASMGYFGGLLVPGSVNAVLKPGLDSTALTTEEKGNMDKDLEEARNDLHPYLYPSVSLGMNFFIGNSGFSSDYREEWFESMTASLLWGGYSGDYGYGWELSMGKVVGTPEGYGLGWNTELFPMRMNNNTFSLWLGKFGADWKSNFLFMDVEASASVGYGWNWDMPTKYAEDLYGMNQKELSDSLTKQTGYLSPNELGVDGTKYGELRFSMFKRIGNHMEFFVDVTSDFGAWQYYDDDSEEGLKGHWGFSPPALAIGIKYCSVTSNSED